MKKLKTPLRYPGGKSRAIKKLFEHFLDLNKYQEYREPFIGGGSVAIAITKEYPDISVWVNDLYFPLYNFWIQLRDNGEMLSYELRESKLTFDNEDKARKLFEDSKEILNDSDSTPLQKAKAFWIINKCSFSGLTESSSFSKSASNSNFSLNGIDNLVEYSKLIKNWKITNLSYSSLFEQSEVNVFVYLDPPYEISSNLYGKKGNMHKGFDHDLFAKNCNKSVYDIAISYNSDQSVKDRFPDWRQIEFDLTYTMRSTGEYLKKQKDRKELLLVNYNK